MLRGAGWLPLLMLSLLIGLTSWLSWVTREPAQQAERDNRHEPDAIIENFVAKKLDPQGQIRFVVNAQEIRHFPDDNSSDVVGVRFQANSAGQPPLIVTSKLGRLTDGTESIQFRDNVVIERKPTPALGGEPLTVITDELTALTDAGTLTTRAPVLASTPTMRIRSQGLDYDHGTRVLRLYKPRATLDPPKR